MKCVKGNKIIEIDKVELDKLINDYEETVIDLGTGDGRFIYKNALANPKSLFIGIDTLAVNMAEYSKRARKEKLYNALFVVGSLEILPSELSYVADRLFIILPWGTLLQNIVNVSELGVKNISFLLKSEANLEIIFGYDQRFEPSESKRLELPPEINENLIKNVIAPVFLRYGNLTLTSAETLSKADLENFESSWSKKIAFGNDRPIYKLIFKNATI